jgi:hypothetical protein
MILRRKKRFGETKPVLPAPVPSDEVKIRVYTEEYLVNCRRNGALPQSPKQYFGYEFVDRELWFRAGIAFENCRLAIEKDKHKLQENLQYLQDQEYITQPDGSIVKKYKKVIPGPPVITQIPDFIRKMAEEIAQKQEEIALQKIFLTPAPEPEIKAIEKEIKELEQDPEVIFKAKRIFCPECWGACNGK